MFDLKTSAWLERRNVDPKKPQVLSLLRVLLDLWLSRVTPGIGATFQMGVPTVLLQQ